LSDYSRVLVLGAASWNRLVYVDALPQGHSATIFSGWETEAVGSTGVGKSMALSALGFAPTFHCSVGQDSRAEQIIAACEDRDIRMLVDRSNAPTAHHLNLMDKQGGRYSIFLSNGDPDPNIDEDRIAQEINAATTIFLSLSVSSKKLLHLVGNCKAEILLDLHDYDGSNPWYEDFIACADVIQLSDVALHDEKLVIARLLSGRAKQVVLTRGADGAEIFTETQHETIPVCPAQMSDSNGAGDTFSVALWLGQRRGLNLYDAGKFAASAAAFSVESACLTPREIPIEQVIFRAENL